MGVVLVVRGVVVVLVLAVDSTLRGGQTHGQTHLARFSHLVSKTGHAVMSSHVTIRETN